MSNLRQGLREHAGEVALLIVINFFVGGMVGLERTVVPLLGAKQFGLSSASLITSFIVSFGITKALVNLISGALAERWGRKPVLLLGWLAGIPVPLLIIYAPSWSWIVMANVLLGVNQGFAWSMTVLMKIDLAGPSRRGLAVGLNECAGYGAVAFTALLTGYIAAHHGLRPAPFYLGIGYAAAGLLLSLFTRETSPYVQREARVSDLADNSRSFRQVFATTTWRKRSLLAACQAGLVTNLNDGMAWGILPLFFYGHGLSVTHIGLIKGVYPMVWAVGQLVTGPLSDRMGRKGLIVGGMFTQAAAHPLIAFGIMVNPLWAGLGGAVVLGSGTAMAYPTLLASVSDIADPMWRARALSVYRFWRDLGYAIGAATAGVVASHLGLFWSIHVAGLVTFASGLAAWRLLRTQRQVPPASNHSAS